jgi:predicted nucleic acid-binding protein
LGLDGVRAFLRRHRRIALDTSVFIYQMEAHPRYLPASDLVFAWLDRRGSQAVTSTITMTELLVPAYREADEDRVNLFYGLLSTYPSLRWIPPDLEIADLAARLRARHGMRTPDSLQAATAMHAGASGMITNDEVFCRVEGFETLVLERML